MQLPQDKSIHLHFTLEWVQHSCPLRHPSTPKKCPPLPAEVLDVISFHDFSWVYSKPVTATGPSFTGVTALPIDPADMLWQPLHLEVAQSIGTPPPAVAVTWLPAAAPVEPMDAPGQDEGHQGAGPGGRETHTATEAAHCKVEVVAALGVDLYVWQASFTFLEMEKGSGPKRTARLQGVTATHLSTKARPLQTKLQRSTQYAASQAHTDKSCWATHPRSKRRNLLCCCTPHMGFPHRPSYPPWSS